MRQHGKDEAENTDHQEACGRDSKGTDFNWIRHVTVQMDRVSPSMVVPKTKNAAGRDPVDGDSLPHVEVVQPPANQGLFDKVRSPLQGNHLRCRGGSGCEASKDSHVNILAEIRLDRHCYDKIPGNDWR